MSERLFVSRSESETRDLGRKLGEKIEAGLCVLLYGDLGNEDYPRLYIHDKHLKSLGVK